MEGSVGGVVAVLEDLSRLLGSQEEVALLREMRQMLEEIYRACDGAQGRQKSQLEVLEQKLRRIRVELEDPEAKATGHRIEQLQERFEGLSLHLAKQRESKAKLVSEIGELEEQVHDLEEKLRKEGTALRNQVETMHQRAELMSLIACIEWDSNLETRDVLSGCDFDSFFFTQET